MFVLKQTVIHQHPYVVLVMVLHCCDFSKMRSKKFERASLKVFLIKCYKIPVFNQVAGCICWLQATCT